MVPYAELDEIVDRIAAGTDGLNPNAAVGGLDCVQRNLTVLSAVKAQLVGTIAESGAWGVDGAASMAAWLRHRYGLHHAVAFRDVKLGRHLLAMPATGAALRAAEIGVDHAHLLVGAHRFNPDAFERDEHALVAKACTLRPDQLAHTLARWRERVDDSDPDVLDAAERDHLRRRFHASATFGGATIVDGVLYGDDGAIVRKGLEAYVDHLRSAEQNTAGEVIRTPAQLRADAEVEIHRVALDVLAGRTRPKRIRPQLDITVDAGSLGHTSSSDCDDGGALLDRYGPILRSTLQRLGCDADVALLITGAGAEPLALGRSQRLVSLAQRRVLDHRDGGCRFPGCDRPGWWCDAHHIITWNSEGGPTDTWNLLLLCRHHHRLVHEGRHRARHNFDDATLEFRRPDGSLIQAVAWPSIRGRPPPRSPSG